MNPRSEPLLWLQLVALGALPLELLGLVLVLAGADPGPLPGLERLLAWAIGALGPAILLWQRPADVCSLLVIQVPIKARSRAQLSLAALQSSLVLKLLMAAGAAALLPLFWWIDQHAALATPLSPLTASPRFVGLLVACPLLAVITWQWQQLIQASALLIRNPATLLERPPLSLQQLVSQRISLGLPLLLLNPLLTTQPTAPETSAAESPAAEAVIQPEASSVASTVAIQPEETAEQAEGTDLDQQVS
ncbi:MULTISPECIES: low-complexity tail membrane protein [unclassified Cyanobium]|uniref:low-complexity tail membrane protein n=1 Tax=unclassified Cyanobium TaxID=2627006 RepID=UPI0020CBEA92|nr:MULTISPECIES: low-complexity tail membrane protein [unclassified Cyanobium]MCP9778534.1 low-complexity tail membrane protein [Cyanobium sp. Tous-M-B4]MCP9877187.1 low-complexity tail membrane protein [Cyanobium sp. A2C-AMD]